MGRQAEVLDMDTTLTTGGQSTDKALAMGFAMNRCGFFIEPLLMTPTLQGPPWGGVARKAGPTGRSTFPVGLFLRPAPERGR